MIGTKFAHYEITGHLGSGGMGEVYQATDSKLGRSVAIKLLPEAFSHDNQRVARFEREARVLASLNHPNIATIHGLEESGGRRFLVMELVPGETLAGRIARGPIAVAEALQIAKQIAESLEYAHGKGVMHRDLKPANIKVTVDGNVKVLDFGLAKAFAADAADASLSNSPTLSMASTNAGMIMGTPAYMSPEQANGKEADRTSDVWAFGCVLYEMLTRRAAFKGETVSEVLAGVLKADPSWQQLPAETPEGIRRLLRRCLQKEQKLRLRDIADARLEIVEAQSGQQMDGQSVQTVSRHRERLWVSALALVTLIAAVAIVWAFRPVPSAPEMRVEITTPSTADPASLAISPDGQKIAFVAISEGRSRLWLRSLDSVSARPLAGTDYAQYPFWSPDSRAVGFYADKKLKRIDIDGGSVQALADVTTSRGGAWNRNGTILFTPSTSGPIFRISATGGEPAAATRLEAPQQTGHRFPHFLPDGNHFLYYVTGTPEARGVYIGQLEGSETRRVFDAEAAAVYASSGQLLFVRQGTLLAQNFDPGRLALTGSPSPVAEQLTVDAGTYLAALSASAAGPIAYRAGSAGGRRQFAWFDRSGNGIGTVGDPDSAAPLNPSMLPDGRRVALHRTVNGNTDLWLLETERGVLTRFTFDAASEGFPIWSPDGSRIVFASSSKGVGDLYQKPATGAGSEELILATAQNKVPADWSPDGRFLLYTSSDPKMNDDIWALPWDGDRRPFPIVQTNFDERDPQFSPDGKWIAYHSNESGRVEIYVQPFPGPEGKVRGKWQVSTNGGTQVRWRRDGKELFYVALDNQLMAVPIRVASNGQAVEAGAPVPLFATRMGGALQSNYRQQYIASPDGQRFLMNTLAEEATSPITIILNWKAKP